MAGMLSCNSQQTNSKLKTLISENYYENSEFSLNFSAKEKKKSYKETPKVFSTRQFYGKGQDSNCRLGLNSTGTTRYWLSRLSARNCERASFTFISISSSHTLYLYIYGIYTDLDLLYTFPVFFQLPVRF